MAAVAVLFYAAVLVGVGFGGSFLIARTLAGAAALLGWIVWLGVPVAFLAVAFAIDPDPTLSPEQASYNYWMALVLTSIGVMLVWLPASVFGGVRGQRARLRRGGAGPDEDGIG